MHKKFLLIVFLIIALLIFTPIGTYALSGDMIQILDCDQSLLGNPQDPNSVAWLVQQALDVVKIAGPALVLVLSSVEFVQVILSGDDAAMGKAQKKLIIRLLLAGALFILPFLVNFLLDLFGLTSSGVCGIN